MLDRFESTCWFFFVYISSISIASGPILSITTWFAKVLHVRAVLRNLGARAKKNLGALSKNIKTKLFYMFLNLLLDLGFSKDLD